MSKTKKKTVVKVKVPRTRNLIAFRPAISESSLR